MRDVDFVDVVAPRLQLLGYFLFVWQDFPGYGGVPAVLLHGFPARPADADGRGEGEGRPRLCRGQRNSLTPRECWAQCKNVVRCSCTLCEVMRDGLLWTLRSYMCVVLKSHPNLQACEIRVPDCVTSGAKEFEHFNCPQDLTGCTAPSADLPGSERRCGGIPQQNGRREDEEQPSQEQPKGRRRQGHGVGSGAGKMQIHVHNTVPGIGSKAREQLEHATIANRVG